jgi:hypothetical protein
MDPKCRNRYQLDRNTKMPYSSEEVSPFPSRANENGKAFLMNRYKNLQRLLEEEDVEFLESFGLADEARKLRSGRRRIYLGYVRALSRYAQRCQRERLMSGYDQFSDIMQWHFRINGYLVAMRFCAVLHQMHVQSAVRLAGSCLQQLEASLHPVTAMAAA